MQVRIQVRSSHIECLTEMIIIKLSHVKSDTHKEA